MSVVQVIPLGGVGEIGKNCTAVVQGDDLILVDCGISFPNEDMPGVDVVIPDFKYVQDHADQLRGVFLTHAHEDHVGALPFLLNKVSVPIYCTEFTAALIRPKLDEKLGRDKYDIRIFKPGDRIQAGSLEIETIRITHSIPENCAIAIHTAHGVLLFTSDFKLDFTPVDNKPTDLGRLGELGKEGVLCLFSDSTNVEREGWGPSERSVNNGLRKVYSEAEGRILMTTFASNIHRMQQVIDLAAEFGRKVAVVGRRMEQNLEICTRLGYVRMPKDIRVPLEDIKNIEDHRLVILTTGSQGEPMSALVQMSKGEYGRLQIKRGDTLMYSARPIPGNEAAIWRTVNRLFDLGCRVVYESSSPIHVSGHAYQEELKMMINLTRPFYVAPVHGEARHQYLYNQFARQMGYPEHRIFTLRAGVPLVFDETSAFYGEPVDSGVVLVDRSGRQGIARSVMEDRIGISREGVVMVTIPFSKSKRSVTIPPTVSARAFNGEPYLLKLAADMVFDALAALTPDEFRERSLVEQEAVEVARRTILKKAGLRPVIVPILVELP